MTPEPIAVSVVPKVSVILTTFKRTTFLEEAIRSVLAQTFDSYEIIVTDNSQSPEIERICASFSASGKVRYRHNSGNVGVVRSLRNAMSEAVGRYISILNDDDVWESEFLEAVVGMMEAEPGCVVGFCDHWIIDERSEIDEAATNANSRKHGRIDLPGGRIADPEDFVINLNGVPLAMGAVFERAALDLSLLVPEAAGAYDLWMSAHFAALGRPFCYVPRRLTRYRVHRTMETARQWAHKHDCQVFVYSEVLRKNLLPQQTRILRARLAEAYFGSGRSNQAAGNLSIACGFFVKAIREHPSPRTIAGLAVCLVSTPVILLRPAPKPRTD